MAALPYFDEIDPSTIDVLLVTQYDPFVVFYKRVVLVLVLRFMFDREIHAIFLCGICS